MYLRNVTSTLWDEQTERRYGVGVWKPVDDDSDLLAGSPPWVTRPKVGVPARLASDVAPPVFKPV